MQFYKDIGYYYYLHVTMTCNYVNYNITTDIGVPDIDMCASAAILYE